MKRGILIEIVLKPLEPSAYVTLKAMQPAFYGYI
jgi:hypothetical protein